MNAFAPIAHTSPSADWDQAQAELHLWLGRCVDSFTEAEKKVSETLQHLARHYPEDVKLHKAHLFGQKLQLLLEALEAPLKMDQRRARLAFQALNSFLSFAELRNAVCHGASTLYLGRDGQWLVELKTLQLATSTIVTTQLIIDKAASEEKLRALKSATQSLSAQLANLCASLAVPASTNPSAPAGQASR